MFTGLVQEKARIVELSQSKSQMKVKVEFQGDSFLNMSEGDSIMIDGVCLTARDLELDLELAVTAWFDVSHETLSSTRLSSLKSGDSVHAEASLKAGDPVGGHFVTGHVEGTGEISSILKKGEFIDAVILFKGSFKEKVATNILCKGSIAIDGVSLTVNSVDETDQELRVGLTLIPETIQKTKWSEYKVGDLVNIETDMLVKTVSHVVTRFLSRSVGAVRPIASRT